METKRGGQILRNSFNIEQFGVAWITVVEREDVMATMLVDG
ncbi:hypothetical protein [Nostoc sp. UHCC 0251]|nr:hypothetical protein [Nostoc sp. UHCC 0251]MEA5624126.1 hypothetical protein [Nostoc sp. UHCC 0251]